MDKDALDATRAPQRNRTTRSSRRMLRDELGNHGDRGRKKLRRWGTRRTARANRDRRSANAGSPNGGRDPDRLGSGRESEVLDRLREDRAVGRINVPVVLLTESDFDSIANVRGYRLAVVGSTDSDSHRGGCLRWRRTCYPRFCGPSARLTGHDGEKKGDSQRSPHMEDDARQALGFPASTS